jgi:hypothetical protein
MAIGGYRPKVSPIPLALEGPEFIWKNGKWRRQITGARTWT